MAVVRAFLVRDSKMLRRLIKRHKIRAVFVVVELERPEQARGIARWYGPQVDLPWQALLPVPEQERE